jgi:hypothetical protein
MIKDGGGESLILAHQQRHGLLPEGEGDQGALLQGAAVLHIQILTAHFSFSKMLADMVHFDRIDIRPLKKIGSGSDL